MAASRRRAIVFLPWARNSRSWAGTPPRPPARVLTPARLEVWSTVLGELAGEAARRFGDQPAYVAEDGWSLSYAELVAGGRLAGEAPPELPDVPERKVAIVFTSGTTGAPRGAVFANRQLAAVAAADVGQRWGGGGRTLAGTSLAHIGTMSKLAGA